MNNWIEENNQLTKTYVFQSFTDAIAWMVKASFAIEKLNHHNKMAFFPNSDS